MSRARMRPFPMTGSWCVGSTRRCVVATDSPGLTSRRTGRVTSIPSFDCTNRSERPRVTVTRRANCTIRSAGPGLLPDPELVEAVPVAADLGEVPVQHLVGDVRPDLAGVVGLRPVVPDA